MSLDVKNTVIPARGIVAIAKPQTAPPDPYHFNPADPTTYDISAWYLLHVSTENMPEIKTDGGDATTLGSWWNDSIDTTYKTETISLDFNSLELNAVTLQAAWPNGTITPNGGWAIPDAVSSERRALFMFALASSGRMTAMYAPNTDCRAGDMPKIDTEKYFEISLSAQLLGASDDVTDASGQVICPKGTSRVWYTPAPLVAAA